MAIKKIPKGALKLAWKTFGKKVEQNLPTILHGAAVICGFAAVGLAIRETPKANVMIETKKVDKILTRLTKEGKPIPAKEAFQTLVWDEKLSALEMGEVILTNYWPTGLCLGVMTGLTVWAETMHIRHIAALTAGIALVEKDRDALLEKGRELIGKKKVDETEHEIAKDIMLNVPDDKYIVQTTHGHTLFYEPNSRNYFYSSIDAVKDAISQFREKLRKTGEQSVTDLCYYLDVPLADPYLENHLHWTYDGDFHGTELLDINVDYIGHPVTGEPCATLLFSSRPTWSS